MESRDKLEKIIEDMQELMTEVGGSFLRRGQLMGMTIGDYYRTIKPNATEKDYKKLQKEEGKR
jgi:hypothetical protein